MPFPHVYTLEKIELTQYHSSDSREKRTFEAPTILVTISGEGEIRIENNSYRLDKSGMVIFCNPGTTIHFTEERTPSQGLRLYRLTIGAYSNKSEMGNLVVYEKMKGKLFENGEAAAECYHQIKDLAQAMELASHEQSLSGRSKLQMLFHEMMYMISQEDEAASRLETAKTAIERATAYMEEHYQEDIHRDQIAQMVGLNQEYFSRLFKKDTGRNFSKYLTEIRINKAQEFLLTSKASLREIAQRVGYRNEFYLSSKFKEVTGVSPSLYLLKPKRIASVSSHFTACLLTLGVTPVVAKINPFIEDMFKTSLQAGATRTVDLHTFHYNHIVAEARPELILCYDAYPEIDELKRIAPTITIPLSKLNWREQFLFIADVVNEADKAKQIMSALDAKAEQARLRINEKVRSDATVAIIDIWKDKIFVYGDSGGRGGQLIYQMLKLSPPPIVRKEAFNELGYKIILPEDLPLYSADYLFVTIFKEKGGEPYASEIMVGEIWRGLPAVRNHRVYVNDHGTFYNWDPASMEVQLDLVARHLMS